MLDLGIKRYSIARTLMSHPVSAARAEMPPFPGWLPENADGSHTLEKPVEVIDDDGGLP
jgi:hypothetical protein